MTFRECAREAWHGVKRPRIFLWLCAIGMAVAIMLPADLSRYRDTPRSEDPLVHGVENYGRFINTVAQIGMPILMRDPVGFMQSVYLSIASTFVTHGLKRALDNVEINDRRLGERPNGGKHNMPSGHSSMASCAMYFVARRYGWWHLLYLLPITLLTMYTRVELDAHTWPAVIAGALGGILCAAFFTGKFTRQKESQGK